MATKAKPTGATPRGKSKKDGANGVDLADIRKYFDEIHGVTDTMEEDNAAARGEIGRVYEKASDKLGMTKTALKFMFRKERRERKDDLAASKMDVGDRDSLEKASQAWGDGTFGTWLSEKAKLAGNQSARETGEE